MSARPSLRLLVGLGNPGSEYTNTRHNVGVWFVDQVLRHYGGAPPTTDSKLHGLTSQLSIGGTTLRILVPTTFMNNSGRSVAAIANFYKIDPATILIAHDELDIAPGTARLKEGGGHGGHNGLRDIISCLGNQKQFARLRIGIGHPGNAKQVSNYVLKPPSADDRTAIEATIDETLRCFDDIVSGQWQPAMNQLHSFSATP